MSPSPHAAHATPAIRLRALTDADVERVVDIENICYPEHAQSAEEMRHHLAIWDHNRFFAQRMVATDAAGTIIGYGRINHLTDEFHPRKYYLDVDVVPDARRRGIGSLLLEALLDVALERGAISVRAGVVRETMTDSIRFLRHRGFVEVERGWESILRVAEFDAGRFEAVEARTRAAGIGVVTLADAMARDGAVLRRAHALAVACDLDVPSADPSTEIPYDLFVARDVEAPNALPHAFFLATDGDRFVGTSFMFRRLAQPGVLAQGLTGVLREYRGRGIATVLKLHTVRYAQRHGYREIRTFNHSSNAAMLRVNDTLGFRRQPAWVNFERRLRPDAAGEHSDPVYARR